MCFYDNMNGLSTSSVAASVILSGELPRQTLVAQGTTSLANTAKAL
jgi:hypothetical protein